MTLKDEARRSETFSVALATTSRSEVIPATVTGQQVQQVNVSSSDSANSAKVTLERFDGSTYFPLVSTMPVTADAPYIDGFEFDLPAGHSLVAVANIGGVLTVTARTEILVRNSPSVGVGVIA